VGNAATQPDSERAGLFHRCSREILPPRRRALSQSPVGTVCVRNTAALRLSILFFPNFLRCLCEGGVSSVHSGTLYSLVSVKYRVLGFLSRRRHTVVIVLHPLLLSCYSLSRMELRIREGGHYSDASHLYDSYLIILRSLRYHR